MIFLASRDAQNNRTSFNYSHLVKEKNRKDYPNRKIFLALQKITHRFTDFFSRQNGSGIIHSFTTGDTKLIISLSYICLFKAKGDIYQHTLRMVIVL